MSSSPLKDSIKHSDPIAINTSARRRTLSVSSGSGSPSSESDIQTPSSSPTNNPSASPSNSSPILSYFFSHSPTATPAFPKSRKFGQLPLFEEDEQVPVATHARRASTSVAQRFSQPSLNSNIPEPQLERGSGFLRRLSLSSASFQKQFDPSSAASSLPGPPPNSAVTPTQSSPFSRQTKPRRSATVNEGTKPRRAPSPMGERILKGHFDGFN